VASGISAIIVDFGALGKEQRQAGADTEINHHTIEDLKWMREATSAPAICRINRLNPATGDKCRRG
jgi:hypothetical protein